ncbi:MAG: hypothetical protein KGL95_06250 [Patescibacteria group bacterium]|nr:hypothetical protein [Patescibacteria group bacterium]
MTDENDNWSNFKKEVEKSNPDYDFKWNNPHEHTSEPGHWGFTPDVTDKRSGERYRSHIDPE